VQQVPFDLHTSPAFAHSVVLFPHAIFCPQLFFWLPQTREPHVFVFGSASQPHAFDAVQVTPASQPPHWTGCPQLSCVEPHRPAHQSACGVQHAFVSVRQTAPGVPAQVVQLIVSPQLLTAVPPHLPAQAETLSGVQHVPPSAVQTSPGVAHAPPFGPHCTVCAHALIALPQSLSPHATLGG
jgi:hypothetical protein